MYLACRKTEPGWLTVSNPVAKIMTSKSFWSPVQTVLNIKRRRTRGTCLSSWEYRFHLLTRYHPSSCRRYPDAAQLSSLYRTGSACNPRLKKLLVLRCVGGFLLTVRRDEFVEVFCWGFCLDIGCDHLWTFFSDCSGRHETKLIPSWLEHAFWGLRREECSSTPTIWSIS